MRNPQAMQALRASVAIISAVPDGYDRFNEVLNRVMSEALDSGGPDALVAIVAALAINAYSALEAVTGDVDNALADLVARADNEQGDAR